MGPLLLLRDSSTHPVRSVPRLLGMEVWVDSTSLAWRYGRRYADHSGDYGDVARKGVLIGGGIIAQMTRGTHLEGLIGQGIMLSVSVINFLV
ncbi:hypothetical protein JAAARDRAFT_58697 [Jaapia argillacea MUCL 33604]|uniref:Uncharacterized protein n=1 Tax=Jaapia argillacea MUCL 33604 TaxID=933084 RepID=A0A067Q157_9AGAM|nr:hypothetical protein JAAARDRAFT_58697 [Jaapia argillacea MUCL 33604]